MNWYVKLLKIAALAEYESLHLRFQQVSNMIKNLSPDDPQRLMTIRNILRPMRKRLVELEYAALPVGHNGEYYKSVNNKDGGRKPPPRRAPVLPQVPVGV